MSVADRVERLCLRYGDGDLDELPEPASDALARILASVRDRSSGENLLADLDVIEAAVVADLDGLTVPTRNYRSVRVGGGGHPVAYVAVCPNGACSRRVVRTSANGGTILCGITDQPLEVVRLTT